MTRRLYLLQKTFCLTLVIFTQNSFSDPLGNSSIIDNITHNRDFSQREYKTSASNKTSEGNSKLPSFSSSPLSSNIENDVRTPDYSRYGKEKLGEEPVYSVLRDEGPSPAGEVSVNIGEEGVIATITGIAENVYYGLSDKGPVEEVPLPTNISEASVKAGDFPWYKAPGGEQEKTLWFSPGDEVIDPEQKKQLFSDFKEITSSVLPNFPSVKNFPIVEIPSGDAVANSEVFPLVTGMSTNNREVGCALGVSPGYTVKLINTVQEDTGISKDKLMYFFNAHEVTHCQLTSDLNTALMDKEMAQDSSVLRTFLHSQTAREDNNRRAVNTNITPPSATAFLRAKEYALTQEAVSDVRGALLANANVGLSPQEILLLARNRHDYSAGDPTHDTSPWLYALGDSIQRDPTFGSNMSAAEQQNLVYNFIDKNWPTLP